MIKTLSLGNSVAVGAARAVVILAVAMKVPAVCAVVDVVQVKNANKRSERLSEVTCDDVLVFSFVGLISHPQFWAFDR